MGNIGTGELLIGLLVIVLLFGAKRLPEVARGLGRSMKIFKTEMQAPPRDDSAPAATPATVAPGEHADGSSSRS